jgi:hypothetical protein
MDRIILRKVKTFQSAISAGEPRATGLPVRYELLSPSESPVWIALRKPADFNDMNRLDDIIVSRRLSSATSGFLDLPCHLAIGDRYALHLCIGGDRPEDSAIVATFSFKTIDKVEDAT